MNWRTVLVDLLKAFLRGLWAFARERKLQATIDKMKEDQHKAAVEAAQAFQETTKAVLNEQPATPADIDAVRERLRERAARNKAAR